MQDSDQTYDSIVIGAGQAGLAIGYRLKQDHRRFLVLERGRIGETWRSQRWDTFSLNTPNWANLLPGATYDGPEPDGFWKPDDLLASFGEYVDKFDLPVRTGVLVTAVEAAPSGDGFTVRTDDPALAEVDAKTVVVASGILQTPRIPAVRDRVPSWIVQLHTADYLSPEEMPDGAVVVVGAGQSGCQIVEDLLSAGRTVYLCTSKVARAPRRYRGRDTLDWLNEMGFFDQRVADLQDPKEQFAAQPQISGVGRYGHTVSLQQLEREGARLMGRLAGFDDDVLLTDADLAENIRFADERSAFIKSAIDAYLERTGAEMPPIEDDPADSPAEEDAGEGAPTRLDLKEAGVSSLIWCTGFTADFEWIKLPVLDDSGIPLHEEGRSAIPGLYFVGFPWLRSRKSGILLGAADDSMHIASEVARHLSE